MSTYRHLLLCLLLACTTTLYATAPQIVAHRGFWQTAGSAQNSIASLFYAEKYGCDAIEFDVRLTKDDQVILFHDAELGGTKIIEMTFDELKARHTLPNGTDIPSLEQFLAQCKVHDKIRLVCEIKTAESKEIEQRLTDKTIDLIKKQGLLSRTDFISFSMAVCKRVRERLPGAEVQYLAGDYTPAQLHANGISALDYHYTVLYKNPTWVAEAHELGLKVNCWTVNFDKDMEQMIDMGVDLITTDEPLKLMELIRRRTASDSK